MLDIYALTCLRVGRPLARRLLLIIHLRCFPQVDEWLGGLPIDNEKLIEASRAVERASLGKAFDVFSGIYGAAVKARALRWLTVMNIIELAQTAHIFAVFLNI